MLNKVVAGRFRITGLLGSGGIGQVWAAEDVRMRRDVAVKVVRPQHGTDEAETQARFQREVQLAGRLGHQNIVTVHDWGEVEVEDGRTTLYLVMELVRGVPLGKRLKDPAPTPWPLAVGWASQITQALDAAHRQGVVHRDIKPANVLLTDEGAVKVLDFGVAKFMGDTIGARELTLTGVPLGSPMYMSPEQAQGVREIDHRSDLYSLGCLLYHAVTGVPPFVSATQWAVLRMQIEDTPVAPVDRVGAMPALLNDLILQLLAKHPEDRPADAAAVHETLVTILVEHALMPPGGDVLDLAQLGHALSVSGRFLTAARARADVLLGQEEARRRHEVDVYVNEHVAWAEQLRTQAERTLADARAEAERITEEAKEAAAKTRSIAEALSAQRTREEAAKAAKLLAEANEKADAAERLLVDAEARLERAEARYPGTDVAVSDSLLRKLFQPRGAPTSGGVPAQTPPQPALSPPVRFTVVQEGYDPAQVDDHVRTLEAARGSAATRLAQLERQFFERNVLPSSPAASPELLDLSRRTALTNVVSVRNHADMSHMLQQFSEPPYAPSEPFLVVAGGYDPAEVDQRLKQLVQEWNRTLARVTALEKALETLQQPYQR